MKFPEIEKGERERGIDVFAIRTLSQDLHFLFLLLCALLPPTTPTRTTILPPLPPLPLPPTTNPPLSRLLPLHLPLPPPLPLLHLPLHLPHLPPLLLQPGLHLFPPARLRLDQDLHRLRPPRRLHFPCLVQLPRFRAVDGEFALPQEERARVGDAFVQVRARGGVEERDLRFFEPVEGTGGVGVGGFVRVDQEGEGAVLGFYLRVWRPWEEVED